MLPLRDHLPTKTFAFFNYAIIVANILVFLLERSLIVRGVSAHAVLATFGLEPARLLAHPVENASTIFTSMFMHDPSGLAHLGGNMLFLWIFGDNVEDALGHFRYLFFYLACGVAAAAAQTFSAFGSHVPMVGASGAIAGVLAAYALLYPRSAITVLNLVPFLWLFWGLFPSFPAWLVILLFFVANLWNALQMNLASSGVAFAAHVGGFLAGAVLLSLVGRRRQEVDYARWERWSTR